MEENLHIRTILTYRNIVHGCHRKL